MSKTKTTVNEIVITADAPADLYVESILTKICPREINEKIESIWMIAKYPKHNLSHQLSRNIFQCQ